MIVSQQERRIGSVKVPPETWAHAFTSFISWTACCYVFPIQMDISWYFMIFPEKVHDGLFPNMAMYLAVKASSGLEIRARHGSSPYRKNCRSPALTKKRLLQCILQVFICYSYVHVYCICIFIFIYTVYLYLYIYIYIYGPVLRLSTPRLPPHGLGPQVAAPIPFHLQAIGSISEVQLRIC